MQNGELRIRVFRWLKVIIIIYCGIGIALYYLQEKILLHPKSLPADYVYHFSLPFKEVNISISKNENLNIVEFFPSDSTRKGVILYFHGNMKNINHYAARAADFTKNGYQVWMPDYPGFGKTTGEMTEEKLYKEALLVYKLANAAFSKDSIIIYGRSFGSGVAAYLASAIDSRSLILETPYYSVPALFSHYAPIYPTSVMSKFKLPVHEYLKEVKAPVIIFHGTDDEIIPYSHAKKLKNSLKPKDEFISLEGGKHNNLNSFYFYKEKLDSMLY